MAETELVSVDRTMKPPGWSEAHQDNDSSSVQDEEPVDPYHLEDRFRVDRRKLEQMLQVPEKIAGNAEDFFQRIMVETDTHITWPSKLKIGAKSKKDPHIKISGHKHAVARARDRVLSKLDTKSNRVTLKIDVSHTDHSHVIGKGGNNIKSVMQDTGCHIHFPDSNRSNQLEKSNQVSIAGQPSGVEQARIRIRELLPLVFMFELPVVSSSQSMPDTSSPAIQQIQNSYNVTVSFKQRAPHGFGLSVIVRGSVNNFKAVKQATAMIMEHLTGTIGASLGVTMQLEIAPQHHMFMMGRGGANVKAIMQRTGASIHFPDQSSALPQRWGTVFITGAIDSVYLARQQLFGYLPLVLMFDMKEDVHVDQAETSQLMENLDVFVSIKPKPKQPSKSVIVKSIERNAHNMYEARRKLLKINCEEPIPHLFPSDDDTTILGINNKCSPIKNIGLAGLGLVNQNVLNVAPSSVIMLNGLPSRLTNHHMTGNPPSLVAAQSMYNGMVLVPPSSAPYPFQAVANMSHRTNSPAMQSPHGSPKLSAFKVGLSHQNSSQGNSPLQLSPTREMIKNRAGFAPRPQNQHSSLSSTQIVPPVDGDGITPPSRSRSHSPCQSKPPDNSSSTAKYTPHSTNLYYHNASSTFTLNQALPVSKEEASPSTPSMPAWSPKDLAKNADEVKTDLMKHFQKYQQEPNDSLYSDFQIGEHRDLTLPLIDTTLFLQNPDLKFDSAHYPSSHNKLGTMLGQEIQSRPDNTSGISSEHLIDYPFMQAHQEPNQLERAFPSNDPDIGSLMNDEASYYRREIDEISSGNSEDHDILSNSGHGSFLKQQDNAILNASMNTPITMSSGFRLDMNNVFTDVSLHSIQQPGSQNDLSSSSLLSSLVSNRLGNRAASSSSLNEKIAFHSNGEPKSSESGCESDGSERAPGANRPRRKAPPYLSTEAAIAAAADANGYPRPPPGIFDSTPLDSVNDYEHRKLLANKAMQKKPLGESRRPTDVWAGYGFSKSNPHAIFEGMRNINKRYRENRLGAAYHLPMSEEEEIESENIVENNKDPWMDSKPTVTSPTTDFASQPRILGDFSPNNSGHLDSSMLPKATVYKPTKPQDLAELFSQLSLGKYTDLFQQQEIDLSTFMTLSDEDLKDLGVVTFGARRKMLLYIDDLNKQQALENAAPGSNNPFLKSKNLSSLPRRIDIASQSGRW